MMAKDFHHFIITRFDLRATKWSTDKNNQPTLSNQWYHERFQLFEKYCLGSIRLQSNQQFDWLIIMDTRTDPRHRKTLADMLATQSNLHLLLNHGFDQYLEKVTLKMRAICLNKFGSLPKYMLTTRLDNDDCLHPTFVDRIQGEAAKLEETTLIDAAKGFYIDPKTMGTVEMFVPNNPFLSLFEPTSEINTVLHKMHQEWADFSPRINLTQPLWATVVHERNLRNQLPNAWRSHPKTASDFALFFPIHSPNWIQRLGFQLNKHLGNAEVFLKRIYYPTKRAILTVLPRP